MNADGIVARVADGDISVALSGVFGVVSSLGVIYQIIDMRQRSRSERGRADAPQPMPVHQPVPQQPAPQQPAPQQPWPAPAYPPPATPVAYSPPVPPSAYAAPMPPSVEPPTVIAPSGYAQPMYPPQSAPPVPQSAPPQSPAAWPAPYQPTPPRDSFQVPPYAARGGMYGRPATPRSVVRIRLLLLFYTLLLIPNVTLWMYYSNELATEENALSLTDPTQLVAGLVVIAIFSIPLGAAVSVLSALIGGGRNWARITTFVLMSPLTLLCGCLSIGVPATMRQDAEQGVPVAANLSIAVLTLAMAVISAIAMVMLLLPSTNAYFRSMTQWRRTTGGR